MRWNDMGKYGARYSLLSGFLVNEPAKESEDLPKELPIQRDGVSASLLAEGVFQGI